MKPNTRYPKFLDHDKTGRLLVGRLVWRYATAKELEQHRNDTVIALAMAQLEKEMGRKKKRP